jgi:cysteate synthase
MGEFVIKCSECGTELGQREFSPSCAYHDALSRSYYRAKRLTIRDFPGIWRFYDWLPVRGVSSYEGGSLTYRCRSLEKELGLGAVYVSFNGYWPERGVALKTCTFKELEAAVTVQYARERGVKSLVIASAGNTARSFAYIASEQALPLVLVIPKKCLFDVWMPLVDTTNIKTIVLEGGDYSDAIAFASRLSTHYGLTFEGGCRNIARRDGLGTILLDALQVIGRMPDHYFQAAGTGTGAIAAWEASTRLREDGRFGDSLPMLHLSQNLPFAPMVEAWRAGRRNIIPELDMPKAENILDLIEARVLSNRYPPYGVRGGVYDALMATRGEMYGVTNAEVRSAVGLFQDLEGIDIHPAAGAALGSLLKAVEMGRVAREENVLLNISGGGMDRYREDEEVRELEVDKFVDRHASPEEVREVME